MQTSIMADQSSPLADFIRAFYDARSAARRSGDPSGLAPFISDDVRWQEPQVGDHMGLLSGRQAVLDMIRRALDTTGGSFDLSVTSTLETGSHVAALIDWSAEKDGHTIRGQELAVYEVREGCITAAWFHAADISDDEAFWTETDPT
jgi:ketosteroid isomerase-like protein